jgi:hypothetical protein
MSLLAWSFDPWTLLKPGSITLLHAVYEMTASILTGTNPAFGKRRVRLDHPADAARLYLMREDNTRALELAPLIKVSLPRFPGVRR